MNGPADPLARIVNGRPPFEAQQLMQVRFLAGFLHLAARGQQPPTDLECRASLLKLLGSLENAVAG